MARVDLSLLLSYDTRQTLAFAGLARDQQRKNAFYEIDRALASDNTPRASMVRRPGCTDFGGTYGASGQTPYLVCANPASGWVTPTPWVFTKDAANAIKVHDGSTSTTILTSADYYPRFVGTVNISGTDTVVLQCQNSASPEGAPSQRAFYASAIGSWTEITDSDFTSLKLRGQFVFMDGYTFVATGNGRLHQSAVNSLSGWEPADFLTKGITQDATQGLMSSRNQVLMLGRETAEVFTNQGNATGSVLTRSGYSTFRVGLASVAGADGSIAGKTQYYVAVGSMIFFLGRMGGGAASANLMAWDGQRFEKVSRTYEDKILSSTEAYSVNKIAFFGKIGIAIQLTAPGATTQRSLVFVPDVSDWFEWESTVFSVVNNGVHFLGATDPTKLYHFPRSNNYQDAGTAFDCILQFKMPASNDNRMQCDHFGVVADTVAGNSVYVSFCDTDDGTFGSEREISLASVRKRLYGCGQYQERMVKIRHTGSGELRMHGIYADLEEMAF